MAKTTGFMEFDREHAGKRKIDERVKDWKEYDLMFEPAKLNEQAARCMDCGVPYCMSGCPLGNIIPDFNDYVYQERWEEAAKRLHATNNFPEFTGTICPAPCENSCTLAMQQYEQPINIKQIERAISRQAWDMGWVRPLPPREETGKKVAIVGSGPAGLAAAQQLRRVGHAVTVFERDDRVGGLLMYGIPNFKMDKELVFRRVRQMEQEGVVFKTGHNVGVNPTVADLKKEFDAIVLCGGATQARNLPVEGRDLDGVHFAMDYLTQSTKSVLGDQVEGQIHAKGKHVVVIGGGDTGADCIGTATRQGAASVTSLEIVPRPPDKRAPNNPWPEWARVYRTAGAHEENGERLYSIMTQSFEGKDGKLTTLNTVEVDWSNGKPEPVKGTEKKIQADLVFLAMGFTGPEKGPLLNDLGVELDQRGNVKADPRSKATSVDGVFTAGDMTRGQSLVVWAISEGRAAAKGVDEYLMGSSQLAEALTTA